jgi:hypothetical protein
MARLGGQGFLASPVLFPLLGILALLDCWTAGEEWIESVSSAD